MSDSDDFATNLDRIYGSFDPRVDHIRATDTNGHYENLYVGEWGMRVKVPPRTMFIADLIIASPNNMLRSRNDLIRDSLAREFMWRHEQEKDANLILASEMEVELRRMESQTKMARAIRLLKDDEILRDEIVMLLSKPYQLAVEALVEEQIDMLRSDQFRIECLRKLEDYRRRR